MNFYSKRIRYSKIRSSAWLTELDCLNQNRPSLKVVRFGHPCARKTSGRIPDGGRLPLLGSKVEDPKQMKSNLGLFRT
jgi:hypothetical protein